MSVFRKPARVKKGTHPLPDLPLLDHVDLTKVDPWAQLEFLRIELLLRAETVQNICCYERNAGEILLQKYDVPIMPVFTGWHHQLLTPMATLVAAGIWDMGAAAKKIPGLVDSFWKGEIEKNEPRYLYLCLDTTQTARRILAALGPLLRDRHKHNPPQITHPDSFDMRIGSVTLRRFQTAYHSRKRPPLKLKTWLTYLRCYDLHESNSTLTQGQIAQRIYPNDSTTKGTDRVKKALKRVPKLIQYVEQEDWREHWPPPTGFLNAK